MPSIIRSAAIPSGPVTSKSHFSEPSPVSESVRFHSFLPVQMARCRRRNFLTAGKVCIG